MDTRWLSDLPLEKQEDFKKRLNNSDLLRKLLHIVEDEERSLDRKESTIDDFSEPNWSHRQAFRNGDRSRIRKVKDLLSFVRR